MLLPTGAPINVEFNEVISNSYKNILECELTRWKENLNQEVEKYTELKTKKKSSDKLTVSTDRSLLDESSLGCLDHDLYKKYVLKITELSDLVTSKKLDSKSNQYITDLTLQKLNSNLNTFQNYWIKNVNEKKMCKGNNVKSNWFQVHIIFSTKSLYCSRQNVWFLSLIHFRSFTFCK